MQKRLITIIASGLVALGLLAATPAQAETKVWKFGAITPLSGWAASWGVADKNALELAVKMINDAGGFKVGDDTYMMEVVVEDSKADPAAGLDAAKKLVYQDKVSYMSTMLDEVIGAVQPFLEENHVINVTHAANPLIGVGAPRTFRMNYATPLENTYHLYRHAIQNLYPEAKTIAIIAVDDGVGAFCGASSVASAKAVGLEVLSEDYFSLDTTDFSSLVLKLQRLKPDVLDISGVYDSFTAPFMKSAQELGVPWKMGVIGGGYFSGTEMVRAGAPDEMIEGMLTLGFDYHSDVWATEIREAAEMYEQTYGFIQPWVIHSMSAIYVMKSVMERSGSVDRDKMYEYMSAPDATFDSLFGEIGLWEEDSWFFGINRVLQVPQVISIYKDGKDVNVDTMPWEEYGEIWRLIEPADYPGIAEWSQNPGVAN